MNQNRISSRRAEFGDKSWLKQILFDALHQYKIDLPPNYSVDDIDEIGTDTYGFESFVLLNDNSIIGFFILRPIDNKTIELKRLYLTKSERNKGLGRLLLNKAIDHAMTAGYKTMCLETTSRFKAAVSMYRQGGFREMGGINTAPGHDLAFRKNL